MSMDSRAVRKMALAGGRAPLPRPRRGGGRDHPLDSLFRWGDNFRKQTGLTRAETEEIIERVRKESE